MSHKKHTSETASVALADDLWCDITQTDTLTAMLFASDQITKTEDCFHGACNKLEATLSPGQLKIFSTILNLHCEVVSAYGDVHLAYGLRVADAFRLMTENPKAIEDHICRRIAPMREGAPLPELEDKRPNGKEAAV